jgi:DNA-binding MarR family transcriptional regulator
VSKQTVGQLVDTLVVRGYLERTVGPDARLVAVVGTERMTNTRETLAALPDLRSSSTSSPEVLQR